MHRSLLVIALCLLSTETTQAQDWPVFRGPHANGHADAKDLPQKWSTTENVKWKQAIPGKGWSTPVIVGNRVYLTAAVPSADAAKPDYSLRLLCLDVATGKQLFDNEIFKEDGTTSPPIHRKNSHASPRRSSPEIAFTCTSATKGQPVWIRMAS